MSTRREFAKMLSAATAAWAASPLWASEPDKAPVRLVVAFGGGSEAIVRLLAPKISEGLGGQPVYVDPQTAASGMVAVQTVGRAAPDGLTILVGSSNAMIFRPLTMRNAPYDPIRDFTPISQFTSGAFTIAVNPRLGINTFSDLVEYARRNPTNTRFGMAGNPSVNDLNRVLIENRVPGLKLESIPYKDEPGAIVDAVAGHITGAIVALSGVSAMARDGKLTVIAMLADERRAPFENVPTIGELVPGVRPFRPFTGFWGPAGMQRSTVERLNRAIDSALNDKDIQARVISMGSIARSSTDAQLRDAMADETRRMADALKSINFKAE